LEPGNQIPSDCRSVHIQHHHSAVYQGRTSALEGTPDAINEAFIADTQPGGIR